MKILFIYPKWEKYFEGYPELKKREKGSLVGDSTIISNGITTVAALTPDDYEVELFDDHFGEINYDTDANLIAITSFTPQASRAYEIADNFRKRKKYTVIGGIHPTLMYEEAGRHADTVIIGEAEKTWEIFLKDFKNNNPKKYYFNETLPQMLKGLKLPRRSLFKKEGYIPMDVVQTSRGCPFNCEVCVIPKCYGRRIRFRPINEVIDEIEKLTCKTFFFADDNLLLKKNSYTKRLFKELIPLNKKFVISGSLTIMASDSEMLELAGKAGCEQLYTVYGFCPISIEGLGYRKFQKLEDATKLILDNGIQMFSSFGIGFDHQNKDIFDNILYYYNKLNIELAEFFMATPYPKTPFYNKLVMEKRLLHRDWKLYNGAHVVFKPKYLSEEELIEGFIFLWKDFFEKYSIEEFDEKVSKKYYDIEALSYKKERLLRI